MAKIKDNLVVRALFDGKCIKSENLRLTLSLSQDDCIFRHTVDGEIIPYCKIDVFPDSLVEMVGDWEIVKTEEDIKAISENFSLTHNKEFCFPVHFKSSHFTQSCEEAMGHSRILYCKERDYVLPQLTTGEEEAFIQLVKQNHG